MTRPRSVCLVDEGRMQWDDLSHRSGFSRMTYLESSRTLSSDEILRRASSVEAFAPFRQRFLYDSVQFLAAGKAAAVAGGDSWDELMRSRILTTLGMTATRTSLQDALKDPRRARACWWDEAGQRIRSEALDEYGIDRVIDGTAPASRP